MTDAAPSRFERDTLVTPRGDGRYDARIDPGWWIVAGPNGGYIAALVMRALTHTVADPARAARTLTLHYIARPAEGAARIETRIERRGRSLTSVSARVLQGDRTLCLALAAFSAAREGAPELFEAVMPAVPPPDQCPLIDRDIEMHHRYELRWALGAEPFSAGEEAVCGGWIRLEEPCPADAALVAAYTDALPPALFSRVDRADLTGGVPTVELTIHFRETLPLPGAAPDDYALAIFRTRRAREGFVDEEGEIWSRDGVLLAQSRQLAVIV